MAVRAEFFSTIGVPREGGSAEPAASAVRVEVHGRARGQARQGARWRLPEFACSRHLLHIAGGAWPGGVAVLLIAALVDVRLLALACLVGEDSGASAAGAAGPLCRAGGVCGAG